MPLPPKVAQIKEQQRSQAARRYYPNHLMVCADMEVIGKAKAQRKLQCFAQPDIRLKASK
jgi:hypothetical protein